MNDYTTVISAINFVNSAFLLTLGMIIIIGGLLIINNLIMRFYISMGIAKWLRNTIMNPTEENKDQLLKSKFENKEINLQLHNEKNS
jgi:hypothetical protein